MESNCYKLAVFMSYESTESKEKNNIETTTKLLQSDKNTNKSDPQISGFFLFPPNPRSNFCLFIRLSERFIIIIIVIICLITFVLSGNKKKNDKNKTNLLRCILFSFAVFHFVRLLFIGHSRPYSNQLSLDCLSRTFTNFRRRDE